jgi:hypothetical protein
MVRKREFSSVSFPMSTIWGSVRQSLVSVILRHWYDVCLISWNRRGKYRQALRDTFTGSLTDALNTGCPSMRGSSSGLPTAAFSQLIGPECGSA